MTTRSRIIITALHLVIIVAWVTLIAVDSTRAIERDAPPTNTILHAVLVTALAVATLFTGGVTGFLFLRDNITALRAHVDRRFDALGDGQAEHAVLLEEITGEIPKIQPVLVRAADGRTDDDLDSYARGYVDGLARNPMQEGNGKAKVVSINGRHTS